MSSARLLMTRTGQAIKEEPITSTFRGRGKADHTRIMTVSEGNCEKKEEKVSEQPLPSAGAVLMKSKYPSSRASE